METHVVPNKQKSRIRKIMGQSWSQFGSWPGSLGPESQEAARTEEERAAAEEVAAEVECRLLAIKMQEAQPAANAAGRMAAELQAAEKVAADHDCSATSFAKQGSSHLTDDITLGKLTM